MPFLDWVNKKVRSVLILFERVFLFGCEKRRKNKKKKRCNQHKTYSDISDRNNFRFTSWALREGLTQSQAAARHKVDNPPHAVQNTSVWFLHRHS